METETAPQQQHRMLWHRKDKEILRYFIYGPGLNLRSKSILVFMLAGEKN